VQVEFRDLTDNDQGSQGDYVLHFQKRSQDRIIATMDFDAGASEGPSNAFAIDYFVREDRKQVFISVESGGIRSFLLDYDGRRIRSIYARTEGRERVSATRIGNGRCLITEFWPKLQYRDTFGVRRPKTDRLNLVVRHVIVQE
jgi:hypothetical protein